MCLTAPWLKRTRLHEETSHARTSDATDTVPSMLGQMRCLFAVSDDVRKLRKCRKVRRRHPCVTVDADWAGDPKTRCSTSGGFLATGPCLTVRHWSVTQATVSLSSAESEAKAVTKGCIEALYVKHLLEHQTARPFKFEVWTDSSSAKAIM